MPERHKKDRHADVQRCLLPSPAMAFRCKRVALGRLIPACLTSGILPPISPFVPRAQARAGNLRAAGDVPDCQNPSAGFGDRLCACSRRSAGRGTAWKRRAVQPPPRKKDAPEGWWCRRFARGTHLRCAGCVRAADVCGQGSRPACKNAHRGAAGAASKLKNQRTRQLPPRPLV